MPRHARLLIAERVVPDGNAPSEAVFDINMLVVVGGQERTGEEYGKLLDRAGFAVVQVIATKSPLSLIDAQVLPHRD